MSTFALELQKGVRAALVGSSAVTSLVSTRVYDEPPHDVVYPYIRFGDIIPRSDDTDGSLGAEVTMSIQTYSRDTGRVEATQVAEAVRTLLHRNESGVTLSGINLIELICETYVISRDSDGRGYNGNVVFSVLLQTA